MVVVVAKDRFGVVGWFGFMGVLCYNETQDRWWWWLRRIGLGWWVGLDLWVCCVVVKPQTGGGGGCKGSVCYVVVMVPMVKPQVQSPDRSSR